MATVTICSDFLFSCSCVCVFWIDWSVSVPQVWCFHNGKKKNKQTWENVFSTWGKHSTISSDQGAHFSGQIILTLVETLQKFWSHHSPCHPQLSGKVKTTNGILKLKISKLGTSLLVRWLRVCVSKAENSGLIPGQGAKIPHAMWCGQKEKKPLHLLKSLDSLSLKYCLRPCWLFIIHPLGNINSFHLRQSLNRPKSLGIQLCANPWFPVNVISYCKGLMSYAKAYQ